MTLWLEKQNQCVWNHCLPVRQSGSSALRPLSFGRVHTFFLSVTDCMCKWTCANKPAALPGQLQICSLLSIRDESGAPPCDHSWLPPSWTVTRLGHGSGRVERRGKLFSLCLITTRWPRLLLMSECPTAAPPSLQPLLQPPSVSQLAVQKEKDKEDFFGASAIPSSVSRLSAENRLCPV